MMKRLFVFSIVLFSVSAQSAVVLKLAEKSVKPADQCTITETVDTSLFRADVACQSGRTTSLIFDSQKSVTYFVDHQHKVYYQTSAEEMKKIRAKIDARTNEIRSQIEKRLNRPLPKLDPAAPLITKKQGSKKTVGKFSCQPYLKTRKETKVAESCVAAWDEVKIDFSKYKNSIESWRKFMEAWQKGAPNTKEGPGGSDLASGFLVQEKDFLKDEVIKEVNFVDVKEAAVAADLNVPPKDYKKDVNPMLRDSTK